MFVRILTPKHPGPGKRRAARTNKRTVTLGCIRQWYLWDNTMQPMQNNGLMRSNPDFMPKDSVYEALSLKFKVNATDGRHPEGTYSGYAGYLTVNDGTHLSNEEAVTLFPGFNPPVGTLAIRQVLIVPVLTLFVQYECKRDYILPDTIKSYYRFSRYAAIIYSIKIGSLDVVTEYGFCEHGNFDYRKLTKHNLRLMVDKHYRSWVEKVGYGRLVTSTFNDIMGTILKVFTTYMSIGRSLAQLRDKVAPPMPFGAENREYGDYYTGPFIVLEGGQLSSEEHTRTEIELVKEDMVKGPEDEEAVRVELIDEFEVDEGSLVDDEQYLSKIAVLRVELRDTIVTKNLNNIRTQFIWKLYDPILATTVEYKRDAVTPNLNSTWHIIDSSHPWATGARDWIETLSKSIQTSNFGIHSSQLGQQMRIHVILTRPVNANTIPWERIQINY